MFVCMYVEKSAYLPENIITVAKFTGRATGGECGTHIH